MDDKELLWRQYSCHIDLYKYYLDMVIKLNAFYYAITGGILTFYFSHTTLPNLRFALVLPIAMSLGFGGLFVHGIKLLEITRTEVFAIRDALRLMSAPEFRVLSLLLGISAAIFFLTAIVLLVLLFAGNCIFSQSPGAA